MTSGLNCARNRKVEVGTETLARTSVTELRHACHFGSPQDCLPLSEKQSRTEPGEIQMSGSDLTPAKREWATGGKNTRP